MVKKCVAQITGSHCLYARAQRAFGGVEFAVYTTWCAVYVNQCSIYTYRCMVYTV